jgi:hypothetical protein
MLAGQRHAVLAATVVLFIALVAPAGALAGGCNASACHVYSEPNAPSAGGQQQPSQHPTGPATSSPKQVPTKLSRVLANAGEDRSALKQLLNDSGVGAAGSGSGNSGSPSAFGAAFDLGTGPTVLLGILLATAVAFAVQGGVRGWFHRRSSV